MLSVIIDDGVYNGFMPIPHIVSRFVVTDENTLADDQTTAYPSHGTACATIIEELYPGQEFISIRVLDKTLKGDVECLVTALAWCCEHNARLVHMSIGSANYHDFAKIQQIVERLTAGGAFLIASYSNSNVPSYPAYIPGVFGVRADRGNALHSGEFAFDERLSIPSSNALVAHYGGDSGPFANSYAAPIITAQILRFLQLKPNATTRQVLEVLWRSAKRLDVSPPFLDLAYWVKVETPIPVVVVKQDCRGTFENLLALLGNEGYTVEGFSYKQYNNPNIVPLTLYSYRGMPDGLTALLYSIYQPDIMLFETNVTSPDWTRIDALVDFKNTYTLETETSLVHHRIIGDVLAALLEYFTCRGLVVYPSPFAFYRNFNIQYKTSIFPTISDSQFSLSKPVPY
jgi:hypothetical protein